MSIDMCTEIVTVSTPSSRPVIIATGLRKGAASLVAEAEIAETRYTAFTSKTRDLQVTARLIVRRTTRLNSKTVPEGQSELFTAHRHHALMTDSP